MSAYRLMCAAIAVLTLAGGSSAYGQAPRTGNFGRVVTSGRAPAQASRASSEPGIARASLAAGSRARSSATTRAAGAYNVQAQRPVQDAGASSAVPRSSTARQEARPVAAAPAASPAASSHNYFPTMRPGRSAQQPVSVKAKTATGMVGGAGACMGIGGASGVGSAGGGHR
jgi:hypothetical protein